MSGTSERPTIPGRARPSDLHGTLIQKGAFEETQALNGAGTSPSSFGNLPEQLGPFRLVKLLGRGGMGAVYLAEDTQLRRQAALKVMLPDVAADSRARERFLREARAAAAVRNDHVITVYQVGEENGIPFIAMELLQGITLDGYLAKESIGIAAVQRLGREIAEGLAAAHARNLVHRDIKPANIWLEAPNGRVKLLDFGLARAAIPDPDTQSQLTHDGMVLGTPAYMSPEQARGEQVDFRTDLFSLGTVLYRLCTGQLPFGGPTVTAVLTNLAITHPSSASKLNPKVPDGLSDLIDRLLEKEAGDRPASARAVAEELRELERDPTRKITPRPIGIEVVEDDETEVVEPEPLPQPRSTTRRRRRKKTKQVPTALFAGMGAAAVLLVGGGVMLAMWPKSKPKSTEPAAEVKPPTAAATPQAPDAVPVEVRPIETRPFEPRPPERERPVDRPPPFDPPRGPPGGGPPGGGPPGFPPPPPPPPRGGRP
jgi:serine/threonine protein kinase